MVTSLFLVILVYNIIVEYVYYTCLGLSLAQLCSSYRSGHFIAEYTVADHLVLPFLHAMSLNMIAVHLSTIWQLPINVFKRQTWLTFTFVNMTGGMNESTSLVKGRKSDTDLVLSVYVLHCLGSLCSKKIIYFSCYLHFLVCCFSQPPHIPTIVIIIIIIISVSKFCF